MTIEQILEIDPYSLDYKQKQTLLDERLGKLSIYHYENCNEYYQMCNALKFNPYEDHPYQDLPFLPVRLFKEFKLRSVSEDAIVKTMTSSGTTGQAVSKIFLDKETSANQTKALTKIVANYLGKGRVPMLILDSSDVIKNRSMFSARGAGILGFSMFGSKREYALDSEMNLNIGAIKSFLEANAGQTLFLFGFTFMIWQHFYKELLKTNYKPDLSNAILIHGGGWKKLINERISPTNFRLRLNEVCGINQIYDYYGMVEQTGSIYMECKEGHLHASVFSDIIIRRSKDFSIAHFGEKGIIQVVSILPESYPGHSLLTEDEGIILGQDDCPCGRKGKYFKIVGRIKNAEIRGCSDTYATKFR